MLGLIPVALIVSAGFAAVLLAQGEGGPPGAALDEVKAGTLTYGLVFLGLCLVAHLFMRARLPDADPYLFPLAATLAAVGLVVIYRIDAELAREQAQWFVFGLIVFAATIVFLRDHAVLERYRYTIAAAGIALLLMPRVPGLGEQVNGAFLNVKLGPIAFQPAEFAKIAIIIFLASYLRDTGDVLVRERLTPLTPSQQALSIGLPAAFVLLVVLALALPPAESVLLAIFVASLVAILRERPSLKHFGPLLLVWGVAMFMLLFIRDLGSSLMFFGGFLALLYVATARLSLVGVGATMFLGGATYFASTVSHVQKRIEVWQDPFDSQIYDAGRRRLPDRPIAVRPGRRRPVRPRLRPGAAGVTGHRPEHPAGRPHRPDLRGDRGRDRPLRRLRPVAGLPAVRGARVQDGHGRRRRVLQAAGRGPELGVRAAGVRDRGGRDQGHPADRRDDAVRLLRW